MYISSLGYFLRVVGVTMAAERSRRHNAGNKMSRLLEAEDEDDFYKTTYGGFTEVILFWIL